MMPSQSGSNAPFAQRLAAAIAKKQSRVVVGLDPDLKRIPESFGRRSATERVKTFLIEVIGATADAAVAVKLQSAYFEALGPIGLSIFAEISEVAQAYGLIVIGDVKRNDIGSTAEAYASAYLGSALESGFKTDAITVNAYLGTDGIEPFAIACKSNNKGIFVLVKTSNRSAGDIQDLQLADGGTVTDRVARLVDRLGEEFFPGEGYHGLGAVVGATYPEHAFVLRRAMPRSVFLVPGYGTQGASAKDIVACFDAQGMGAVVNASRSILFAFENAPSNIDPLEAAKMAAHRMRDDINNAIFA